MARTRSFNDVDHVRNGEAVSASVTGRSTRQLEAQIRYLLEQLAATEAGEALFMDSVPMHPDVVEGDAIYWDAENGRFDKALAEMAHDADGGLIPSPRAYVLGICHEKTTASSGKLLAIGLGRLSSTAYENMGSPAAGPYYLSGITPGAVTATAPAVSILVLHVLGELTACESDVLVFVHAHHKNLLEEHVHHSIELFAAPAGDYTPPSEGEVHEITDADSDLVGWLPADHAVFLDKAPAGAYFGYNIEAHDALARIWPPIPPDSAILECIPGDDTNIESWSRIPPEFIQIDSNGIWWMSNCYGQVPWPIAYDGTSGSEGSSCPVVEDMRLILSYAKMTYATNKSVVTSLRPADGQPILLQNENGETATTGDLYILLDISSSITEDDALGSEVVKSIDTNADGFVIETGWVVEGIKSSSPQLIVSGTHSRLSDPTLPAGPSNPSIKQAIVTLSLDLDAVSRIHMPTVERLGGAVVQEYLGITYIGFPEDRDSGVRLQFILPEGAIVAPSTMKLVALMFGRDTGPWAAMTATYYRITRPSENTPTPLAAGDTALGFDVVTPSDDYDGLGTNLPVDNAILIESDSFEVADGDTIYVSLERADDAVPLFDAEIGMIWVVGVITPDE